MAITLLAALAVASLPRWIDTDLAGFHVEPRQDADSRLGIKDSRSGFYLYRTAECDGSHMSLVLTRDRKMVHGGGYKVNSLGEYENYGSRALTAKPLKGLKTGLGVGIGDTPAELLKRIGQPTKTERNGTRNQFTEFIYRFRDVRNGEGAEWRNAYVFKAGKLIEIRLGRDLVPGC